MGASGEVCAVLGVADWQGAAGKGGMSDGRIYAVIALGDVHKVSGSGKERQGGAGGQGCPGASVPS